jgi:hypothetical protein
MGLRRAQWIVRDKVQVPSRRMLARICLTSQLGQRGNEASWHRSSRWAAMAVIEMAFAREEDSGIREGGVFGRRDVAGRCGRQPIGSDPCMPATGGWAWPLKIEEMGH